MASLLTGQRVVGMKFPKLKLFDIVWIHWIDSMARTGWMGIDEEQINDTLMDCYSCGFLVMDGQDFLAISASRTARDPKDKDSVDGYIKIPKVAIQRVKKIRL